MTLDLGTALELLAAALYFTSYGMKSMLPLRALALASNVIAYGIVQSALPELAASRSTPQTPTWCAPRRRVAL